MGRASRRRGTRRHKLRDVDQTLGPDLSRIIHRFPDDWTIRQPTTTRDITRIGVLMRNCLRTAMDDIDERTAREMMHPIARVLADPDGFPRLIFNHLNGDSFDLEAYAEKPAKPEHVDRIHEWHRAAQLGDVLTGPSVLGQAAMFVPGLSDFGRVRKAWGYADD